MALSKVKYFLWVLSCFFVYIISAQKNGDSSSAECVSFGTNIGFSHLYKWDRNFHANYNLVDVNHKQALNIGLDIKIAFSKKKEWVPQLMIGIHTFKSSGKNIDTAFFQPQYEFKNRFYALQGALLESYKIKAGKLENLNLSIGIYASKILIRSSYFKDLNAKDYNSFHKIVSESFSLGALVGADYPIKKIKLGLYYYQRLHFSNFNREISRLVLRISI